MALPEPVIYELKLNRVMDDVTLSAGEATRFSEKCERYLAELEAETEQNELTAVSIDQMVVRVTWAFYYARKGSLPANHPQILLSYISTLEQMAELRCDVEPASVVKER